MITRRELLAGLGAATVLAASSRTAVGQNAGSSRATQPLRVRTIPASGEKIPVIGMGTSGSFEIGADAGERASRAEVLRIFLAGGGRLIDTSPNYGSAEDVLGDLLALQALHRRAWIATKLAATGREAGLAQFAQSLRRLRRDRVDLLQVHNLRDWRTQLAVARELKAAGKVRYVGLTHYLDSAHDTLADALKSARPDFVQLNYSLQSRSAETRLLPMAAELGIAVIVNRAFEDGRLFARVRNQPLPAWAGDVDASSWAQLFLKFTISHPAVSCVIPATTQARHQLDNLRAGQGPLLDAGQRKALLAALG